MTRGQTRRRSIHVVNWWGLLVPGCTIQWRTSNVIVMTFWYVLLERTYFFSNFLNFYSSLGIDHDPPCSLCSHDLCLFLLHVSFFTRSLGQEKSLSYYDLLYDFRSFTLWTHPHPHFPLFPPQPHHPYTPRLCRPMTAPPGEEYCPDAKCGHPEGPDYT